MLRSERLRVLRGTDTLAADLAREHEEVVRRSTSPSPSVIVRIQDIAKRVLPAPVTDWLKRHAPHEDPRPIGWVNFGHLRRVTPISRGFGINRGKPLDRYYIERFLAKHSADVRGRVLEIGDRSYTRAYGGDKVDRSDVLDVKEGNPSATIIGDIVTGAGLESAVFDCVILTQTLLLVYDVRAAVQTLYRILAPGGVGLVTVPGISQIAHNDMRRYGDFWRFTELSARKVMEESFPPAEVEIDQYGNILSAVGFLHGIVVEELTREELDHADEDYPVTIGVRVRKPGAPAASAAPSP